LIILFLVFTSLCGCQGPPQALTNSNGPVVVLDFAENEEELLEHMVTETEEISLSKNTLSVTPPTKGNVVSTPAGDMPCYYACNEELQTNCPGNYLFFYNPSNETIYLVNNDSSLDELVKVVHFIQALMVHTMVHGLVHGQVVHGLEIMP